jgi:hypothetical protein
MARPATIGGYLAIRPGMIDTHGRPLELRECARFGRSHISQSSRARPKHPAQRVALPLCAVGAHPGTTRANGTPSAWRHSRPCARRERPQDSPRSPAGPTRPRQKPSSTGPRPENTTNRSNRVNGCNERHQTPRLRCAEPTRGTEPPHTPPRRRATERAPEGDGRTAAGSTGLRPNLFLGREACGTVRSADVRARAFAAYAPSLRSVRYSTVSCAPSGSPSGTSSAFTARKRGGGRIRRCLQSPCTRRVRAVCAAR